MNVPEQRDPNSMDSYTVAWICALEEEYFCACRMLDEEFAGPEIHEDSDDNVYVYGRIAKHYVVIGCLPAGRYGTNSAARVVRDMVRTFPHLRFALMVGIGGGAPSIRNDIRLGDVVVSQPKDGFGGVIQYDLGKLIDGRFQRTGQLNAPPEKLLGAIPEMRRLHSDKKKPDRLAEHLQRLDDMEDYQRPATDWLYATNYPHVVGENCDNCDSHLVVDRRERQNHRILHVHYGNIASGNSVLKDAIVRDVYANDPELNILCFEMEAAGLMNNVPSLIIRGICDYCDSHKNDDWHKYAALAAAAYARELLIVLRPQRVDAMSSWAERVAQELQQVSQELTILSSTQKAVLTTVESLDQRIDWGELPAAQEAAVDSFANQHEDECLQGTRTELLNKIAEWAVSLSGKRIFWLRGIAGTGKSTISRTVARWLQDTDYLGAAYFFKSGEGDRGNAKKFFPTLIRQLMLRIPELRSGVRKALRGDPDIATKSLKEQFEKLLLQPLLNLDQLRRQFQTTLIVIDALDECENDQDVRNIIRLLPRLQKAKAVHLRIFLTSRPELPIGLGFSEIAHEYQDLALHEIPEELTEHDIHLFLQHRFAKIQHERNISRDWPGDNVIQELVIMSMPLFISAATVCRYIEDSKWEPKIRLAELLADQAKYVSRMDKTYMPILKRLLGDQNSDESEQQQLLEEFQKIVGVIILLAVPLSINALSNFLGIPADQISNRLSSFRSVLSVPDDCDKPVRILHLSFRDFLVQSKTEFLVHELKKHRDIAKLCLKTMWSCLQKDICCLASPGTHRADIDPQLIYQHLSPELQYSCRYWIYHLEQSQCLAYEVEDVLLFLQMHFLHWVESMSLLGLISEVVSMLDLLHILIRGDGDSEIADFLYDAKRFILKIHQIADEAPLQIYCAGLVFAPRTALIRSQFKSELPSWISQLPQVNDGWGAELQALEHQSGVGSVAFSPDGQLLASGSDDHTVRLWDTATGDLQQILEGHSESVESVAFSPDGQLLASGSDDHTVRLWDTATGGLQYILKGHSDWVKSVTFSLDSRLLASGSDDNTVRLWNTATGGLQKILDGYSSSVKSVAFSPNGRLLASGFDDDTVRLWDIVTGSIQQTIDGHSDSVDSVAFSPDGRLLVSGSDDDTIRLWDTTTGSLQQTIEGHLSSVKSVVFSPNGRLLASGSWDDTVRLWDIARGGLQQALEGHSDSVNSVAFSPNGRIIASGSADYTVRLWDASIDVLQQTKEGHLESVKSVAFSPNGRLLASGSEDSTVGLWDPSTGGLQRTLKGHSGSVSSVVFSPNSRLLASSSGDNTVRLWDIATGRLQRTIKGHLKPVSTLAFSPDGWLLASGSADCIVRLWDISTGRLRQTLEGHSESVYSVAFSPNSRLLASSSWDHTVRLWDTSTGGLQRTLKGHSGSVSSVAFSPNGKLLASGSWDNTVKVWDVATGGLQETLGTEGIVSNLKFSQDHSYLITDRGTLDIQPQNTRHASCPTYRNTAIFIRQEQWINVNGRNLLQLPPDFHPFCSAIYGNLLALGHASGRVSFIRFRV